IMKTLSEGCRALLHNTAAYYDLASNAETDAERERYIDLVELLTPICKAYATDQGFWVTERGVQIYGGYGYIREYPMEQYMRDVKIASIYEGTNGIQALDLLGRKMRLKNGGLFLRWLQEANALVEKHKEHSALGDLVVAFEKAKNALAELTFALPGLGSKDPEQLMLQATPFLEAFGHVEVGRLLIEQAVLAHEKLQTLAGGAEGDALAQQAAENSEIRFYDGKVKGARFFAAEFLPRTHDIARRIKAADRSPLDIVF
ncbi:MAG: acyl-CoA dehydrogenase C-terminal domain-containing protein, partial [Myxococcales bacterium]|nr:acyl-CoA dehydrogenase C-terminal domain-containing protein [Myxococcales bacterium]